MKLYEVLVDNGRDYDDHEHVMDIVVAENPEKAIEKVKNQYWRYIDFEHKLVTIDVNEINEIEGYTVTLTKITKPTPAEDDLDNLF